MLRYAKGAWEFSFGTWLHAFVIGSLVTFSLYLYRKKHSLTRKSEVVGVFLTYILCVLRFLIPIEFPVGISIPARGLYSAVYSAVARRHTLAGVTWPSIWEVFMVAITVVAIIKLLCFFYGYKRLMKKLVRVPLYCPAQAERIAAAVTKKIGKTIKCRIICMPEERTPMAVGLWGGNKTVILPEKLYSDKELYYSLLHEFTHFANRDLVWKFVFGISDCILWWNPLFIYLKKDFGQMLEMKCDLDVSVKIKPEEVQKYLQVLLDNVRRGQNRYVDEKHSLEKVSAGLIVRKSEYSIKERFQILCEKQKPARKERIRADCMLIISILVIFPGSCLLRAQPSYEAPIEEIEEDGAVYIDEETTYLINRNGTYFIVMNGGEEAELPPDVAEGFLEDNVLPIITEE